MGLQSAIFQNQQGLSTSGRLFSLVRANEKYIETLGYLHCKSPRDTHQDQLQRPDLDIFFFLLHEGFVLA
jgi:hypothetical protein